MAKKLLSADEPTGLKLVGSWSKYRSREDKKINWALTQALVMGTHDSVAEASLELLARKRVKNPTKIADSYLIHRSPQVRIAAHKLHYAYHPKDKPTSIATGLRDKNKTVRDWAIGEVVADKMRSHFSLLYKLLEKGSEEAADALVTLGDLSVARNTFALRATAPGNLVAKVIGGILGKTSLIDQKTSVTLVRFLGRTPGDAALAQLEAYIAKTPATPPTLSRREAVEFAKALKEKK